MLNLSKKERLGFLLIFIKTLLPVVGTCPAKPVQCFVHVIYSPCAGPPAEEVHDRAPGVHQLRGAAQGGSQQPGPQRPRLRALRQDQRGTVIHKYIKLKIVVKI